MPRYLIEVPHTNSKKSCDLAVSIFKSTGSHFLTNADFGCHSGIHKAWINVELDSKEEAKRIVPPPFREKAKIIRIDKLVLEEIEKYKKIHKD